MAGVTHLNNAPISEAIIDIHVTLPPEVGPDELGSIHGNIIKDYPKKEERKRWEGEIRVNGETLSQTTKDKGFYGFWYLAPDEKQIVQVRMDGFTFNRLKPYGDWEAMRAEANKLWRIYLKAVSPISITRVALRYINRLEFKLPISDFSDYLTAPPTVPEKLPQGVISFLTRVVIHEPEIGAAGVITQTLEPVGDKETVPIILDIDVFKEGSAIDPDDVWKMLDELREFKNRIFFESITERIVDLCR